MEGNVKKVIKDTWYELLQNGDLDKAAGIMNDVIKKVGVLGALQDAGFCDLIKATADKFQEQNFSRLQGNLASVLPGGSHDC